MDVRSRLLLTVPAIVVTFGGCIGADGGPAHTASTARTDFSDLGLLLEGVVMTDDAQPVVEALVTLVDLDRQRLTNAQGMFRFHDVPTGEYDLRVEKAGFQNVTKPVTVRNGLDVGVEITMRMTPSPGSKTSLETQFFAGVLACQAYAEAPTGTDPSQEDCRTAEEVHADKQNFYVRPDALAVHVWMGWDPTTAFARHLRLTLTQKAEQGTNQVLFDGIGTPGLSTSLDEPALRSTFPVGGDLQASVEAAGTDPTAGLPAYGPPGSAGGPFGFAYQQGFEIHVTTYFHAAA